MAEKIKKEEITGNVVLQKFQKKQTREQKNKKWHPIDDAISAARSAYMGNFEPNNTEKTVSFEKAVGDLIEVLEKIKGGELELGGLGEDGGVELPTTAS